MSTPSEGKLAPRCVPTLTTGQNDCWNKDCWNKREAVSRALNQWDLTLSIKLTRICSDLTRFTDFPQSLLQLTMVGCVKEV
jgi:hypothetical protein